MKAIVVLMMLAWSLTPPFPYAIAADSNTKSAHPAKSTRDKLCADISTEDATRLGLIRQTLSEGKPHAAIAQLDASKIKNEQAELLRADGLRQTGRSPLAQSIYEELLNSCLSGYAYRGLGLIASQAGNTSEALRNLTAASNALPMEYTIRNDFGFVLMQSGNYESALHEFLTAVELAPDYQQAANNLILLLYKQGDAVKAEAFAKQFGVNEEQVRQLKQLAQNSNEASY